MRAFVLILQIIWCIGLNSQSAFRDNFIGKYNCLVKSHYPSGISYYNRDLYVTKDPNYSNRIFLHDSATTPYPQFVEPVNLYLDSTFKDTIWCATGACYWGNFLYLDSIYFFRKLVMTTGYWMEYFGRRVSSSVGIEEKNKSNTDFSVFPNPVNNFFKINISPQLTVNKVILLSIDGKEVVFENHNTFEYDVTLFSNGLYFLKIITSEAILSKKISICR